MYLMKCGDQILDAYSSMGLTYTVYALRKKAISRLKKPRNNIPIREWALATMRLIWLSNLREESTSTPASQTEQTLEIAVLVYSYCTNALLNPQCSTWHFSMLTDNCQAEHHNWSIERNCWNHSQSWFRGSVDSGRTSVSDRRTFAVLRSTCGWRVTT